LYVVYWDIVKSYKREH